MTKSLPVPPTPRGRFHDLAEVVRVVVFFGILIWIVFGPFYRQVLGGRSIAFRQWTMFSAIGFNVVDATFYERLPDGRLVELDRYQVLGDYASTPGELPDSWWIVGKERTQGIAQSLCEALGPDTDVRVVARRATRQGWVTDLDRSENICDLETGS